jgi:hypothetical protein
MLTVHDDEFNRLSYMLRAALASISVNLVSIHAINSPQQDALLAERISANKPPRRIPGPSSHSVVVSVTAGSNGRERTARRSTFRHLQ